MALVTRTVGQFPAALQGTIQLTAAPVADFTVGRWVYVGTWATATFKAKVVRHTAGSNTLTVKNISGALSSGATLKQRNAALDGDTVNATGTLADITASTIGKDANNNGGVDINSGGWNIRATDQGITRSKSLRGTSRILAEVLFAQRQLTTKRSDIGTIPTFTLGAFSNPGPYVVGGQFGFTIVSNEPVVIAPGATYPFLLDTGVAKTATFVASNPAKTTHVFEYVIQAGDAPNADADIVVAAGATITGEIYDITPAGNVKLTGTITTEAGANLTQSDTTISAA
jgi:hypothetical protein